jgi:hypothetical protein
MIDTNLDYKVKDINLAEWYRKRGFSANYPSVKCAQA